MSKIFRGQAPGPPFKADGKEGRDGKGKRGRGRKNRVCDRRGGEGSIAQIEFYTYSTDI